MSGRLPFRPMHVEVRHWILGVAATVWLGAPAIAQVSPLTQMQEVQQRAEALAQKTAEELGALSRRSTVGILNPDVDDVFRRVSEAIRLWKTDRKPGASPLLAEGILLDCLGRLQGVKVRALPHEKWGGVFVDVAALRLSRAAKAFEAALAIDPSLVEARMRRARILAPDDQRARFDLERIAEGPAESPFSYLAALGRAAIAQAKHDGAGAVRWYKRALTLNPQSTAATIALSTLEPGSSLQFDKMDAGDLFYRYPCIVLTANVNADLVERTRRVAIK